MAELNEEQLLLLSSLMYDKHSVTKQSVDKIASAMTISKKEQDRAIGEAILKDPELCELIVVDSIDTDGARASCFVNSAGEAIIAVRGTQATYEAWSDNFQGAYQVATNDQLELGAFVEKQAKLYSDITITGHSKGGNLAQYATIVYGDIIDRCVSFDGQGFSDEFVHKYENEINQNSEKIKSICASKDYVNVLLLSIAGETVYLNTNSPDFKNQHSNFYLWSYNSGKLNAFGEFSDVVEQSDMSKGINYLADSLVWGLDLSNPIVEILLINVIGGAVAWGLSDKVDINDIINHLNDIFSDTFNKDNMESLYRSLFTSWIPDFDNLEIWEYLKQTAKQVVSKFEKSFGKHENYNILYDVQCLENVISNLQNCLVRMEGIRGALNRIKLQGEFDILYTVKLLMYERNLEKIINNMSVLKNSLVKISNSYYLAEKANLNL